MLLSIIVPAYNEEAYLRPTLQAIKDAISAIDGYEVIVVDNESTDRTRVIAAEMGVRIVDEHEHNISAIRNAGGRNASGDVLIFIDADTIVRADLFEKILDVMSDSKCVGGSVAVQYGEASRKWVRYYLMGWQFWGRVLKMRQGAAQFCRRNVFNKLGGYDESIFLGEDIEFQWRLAKFARRSNSPSLASEAADTEQKPGYTAFVEDPPVRTSSRRFLKMGLCKTLVLTHPITILLTWRIRSVWKDWYENAVR